MGILRVVVSGLALVALIAALAEPGMRKPAPTPVPTPTPLIRGARVVGSIKADLQHDQWSCTLTLGDGPWRILLVDGSLQGLHAAVVPPKGPAGPLVRVLVIDEDEGQ